MNDFGFNPINTLASTNFDVLKIDGVEDPLINAEKLSSIDLEESYFCNAIAFINESNIKYTNAKLTLYKSISEAASSRVVLESFSDFFVAVKEIIRKFLKFINNMFSKFLAFLSKMVEGDSTLKKYKNRLNDFTDDNSFKITGYKYTFKENVPVAEAILQYNNSILDGLWSERERDLNVLGVKDAISSIDLEQDCAKFRAQVLGETDPIYVTEFSNVLFLTYRNNTSTAGEINVDAAYVNEVKDRYFSYNNTKRIINNHYKQLEKDYKTVENQIQDLVRRNGDLNAKAFMDRLPEDTSIESIEGNTDLSGLTMSSELMTQLDIYVKAKVEQIQAYSNIHTLAFSAKLDALKECNVQDRNTLYMALNAIDTTL